MSRQYICFGRSFLLTLGLSFTSNSYAAQSVGAAAAMQSSKAAVVEIVQDQNMFDDNPVHTVAESVKKHIQHKSNSNIEEANQLLERNPTIANQLMWVEQNRDNQCSSEQIRTNLFRRLYRNCQIEQVARRCDSSQANVNRILASSEPQIAYSNDVSSVKKMIAMEHRFLTKLRKLSTSNKECSNTFRFALTNEACTTTYQNYFDELVTRIEDICTPGSINDQVNQFVTDMRDGDYSGIPELSRVTKAHAKAREAEINLALQIKELNKARIKIQEALGMQNAEPTRALSNTRQTGPQ